nr:ABC transporter permease [Micromonospora endophytica]
MPFVRRTAQVRRMLRVELRRGTAPVAALAMFGAGVWMLAVHPDHWAGRWAGLADYFRVSMLILCALMVAAGAWQAGRERRRDLGELITSTPRPGWHPVVLAWLAVALAGTTGVLLAFSGAAAFVAPVATYAGGGWWWMLAVGVVALGTATAIGTLVGRLSALRVAAPIAGLATYLGLGILLYGDTRAAAWLSPVSPGWRMHQSIPDWVTAGQAGWLLALTVLSLAVAARRWWMAALAGGVAIAVAVPVATGPGPYRLPADPGAVQLVCTDTGPPVCLSRINAFLLDDVTPVVRPVLIRLTEATGRPWRAVDHATAPAGTPDSTDGDTVWLYLDSQSTVRGGLARPDWLRADFHTVTRPRCPVEQRREPDHRVYQLSSVAAAWLLDASHSTDPPAPVDPALERLRALPLAAQHAWFSAYLDAAARCDVPALIRLGQPQ